MENKTKTIRTDECGYVYGYVPEKNMLYKMQEGDGSQLLPQDYELGHDAYVDYETYIYHGDRDRLAASIILCDGELEEDEEELFEEYDGGLFCYHSEDVKDWTDMIENTIRFDQELEDSDDPLLYEIVEL